jgi:hypothetical protein
MATKLEMIASLVDQTSAPLDKMTRGFDKFVKSGKTVNENFVKWDRQVKGVIQSYQRHTRETSIMHREMRALTDVVGKAVPQFGELARNLGEVGLGAGTIIGTVGAAGLAIYETTKKVSEFAESMRALKFASIDSGLSPAKLKQMQTISDELGISVDEMTGSMNNLRISMSKIFSRDPGMMKFMQETARFSGELRNVGNAVPEKQLEALFYTIDKIKGAFPGAEGMTHAQEFLRGMGVSPGLARLNAEQRARLEEIAKLGPGEGPLDKAIEGADKLNEELTKTKAIFESWKVTIGGDLLGPMTQLVKALNNLMQGQRGGLGQSYSDWFNSQMGRGGITRNQFNERFGKFATGGIVTQPTVGLLGEHGPEAVVPLTGGGYDPFARMRMLIEDVFGDQSYSAGMSVGGARGGGTSRSFGEFIARRGGAGAGPLFRPGVGPRARGGGGMGGAATAFDGPPSGTLGAQRAGFMKELADNPKLKDYTIDAMRHEGGVQSNLEQLMNYASMRHMTIRQALFSGQYGPVKHGLISGNLSPQARAAGEAALAKVGAGSNITDYATDQGMRGDPNFAKYMANRPYYNMHQVEGAWFSYHGEQGRRWAEQQRLADQRRALADANHNQALTATGQLDVKVSAPAGTEVKASGGGLFKDTRVSRQVQMPQADSGPTQGFSP